METVEKRVWLDVEIGKAVIELLNPSPMGGKKLLKLILGRTDKCVEDESEESDL